MAIIHGSAGSGDSPASGTLMGMVKLLCLMLLAPGAWGAPVKILVAVHSETGRTRALAEAVRAGAASVDGVEAVLKASGEARAEDVKAAAGILIGTPVHWQTMSAETKRLLDRMGEWLGKEFGEGKTGGVFCTSGAASNGADTTRMGVIAALLSMRFVVVGGVIEGGYGSAGAQAYGEVGDAEKAEARRFGERFARITLKMYQK